MQQRSLSRLVTDKHLEDAVLALGQQCRHMRRIHRQTGIPPLRDFPANFAGLSKIVTGQQLSATSAAAIWGRVERAFQPFEPALLLKSRDADLAALGLSGAKIRTLRAIAAAVDAGQIDFAKLNRQDDDAIRATLTALHGVGPWTADIYLLFALRRADAFAPGDLALQLAVQRIFNLDARPSAKDLHEIAQRWRPWRAAAARLLWADYAHNRTKGPSAAIAAKLKKP
jgi:DNA-3-methyladenine glycosylase II